MKTTSEPLYKTIATDLLQKIETDIYPKETLLPTEAKLGSYYNVSRVTIRQAIQQLVKQGYVKKIQGSGTHVIYSKQKQALNRSAKIIPFSQEMRLIGKTPSAKVLSFALVTATQQIASELLIDVNSPIFLYERLLLGDDFPYCYEQGFMPAVYFPDFNLTHLTNSKIDYIENNRNFSISYSHQIVHAILADEHLQQLLQVAINAPLLEVTHITYDTVDKPIMKARVIFDSTIYQAHFIKRRS